MAAKLSSANRLTIIPKPMKGINKQNVVHHFRNFVSRQPPINLLHAIPKTKVITGRTKATPMPKIRFLRCSLNMTSIRRTTVHKRLLYAKS